MRFNDGFELAAGSVAGRSHALAGRPNQDAFAYRAAASGLVGVVCDGCGSGGHSEVGAALGAEILVEQVMLEIDAGAEVDEEATWERVRARTLAILGPIARAMGSSLGRVVAEYFLFTVLGVAVARDRAAVFGIGDGIFAVGEDVARIGPFPGNAPPYIGYGLSGAGPRFTLHRTLELSELGAVIVGTDGAVEYDARAGEKRPGGRGEVVGPLADLWRDDRYFRNEDAIRRTLYLVNREVTRPLWTERRLHKEPGLLEDDTTLLVVRRKRSIAA
jgi:hypothetical protein